MPPKGSRGRGGPTVPVVGGRVSSRIAEKQEAAQQLAQQGTALATEIQTETQADDNLIPDSSMPPPASKNGRGRGGRPKVAEPLARRGTRRGSRGGGSIASFHARHTPATSDVYAFHPNSEEFSTPHRINAANLVYGGSPFSSEAGDLTVRTQDATANLMNKFVDRLFSVSKDLMSHLTIENRDETWTHELHAHKEAFSFYYKFYSMDPDIFINIEDVRERTKADETPIWSRMTKSVATANLASLWSDVEDLDGDPSNVLNRLPLLERIDDQFPVSFIPGGRQGLESSQAWLIDDDTNKLAFHIRTQRFIETLRGVQQVNPFRLFAKVFIDSNVDDISDDDLAEYILAARYRNFDGLDIESEEAKQYRDAIDSFRAMLTEIDSTSVISKLEQEYSFQPFLADLKDWVESFEARAPGPSRPLPYSEDGTYNTEAQLEAEATASEQGRFALSGIERIRQLQAAAADGEQPQDNPRADSEIGDDSFDNTSITGTDAEVLARTRELPAQYGLAGIEGSLYAAAAADTSKRGGGRKRGRKNAVDGDPDAKRARGPDAAAMPPPPLPVVPLGNIPPGPGAFDPVALSRQSQLISKANRRPAVPKQRKPWTAHDTQQLVRAVDVYKAKWSTIEKAIKEHYIPFNVAERDQQGLRDKARLVKVDILKTDAVLPPAFDLVVLGRKEKDMVIAAGRNPERKEADINNGVPINVLYDPNASVVIQDPLQAVPQVEMNPHAPAPAPVHEAPDLHDGADSVAAIQALRDAPMIPEAPIGGAPDAPMMAAADMGDAGVGGAPSESLGDVHSIAHSEPSIVEVGPNPAAVNA